MSRKVWTETFHCTKCRKPRPVMLRSQHHNTRCLMCQQKHEQHMAKKHERHLSYCAAEYKRRAWEEYKDKKIGAKLYARTLRSKAAHAYLYARKKHPQAVRAPLEDFFPIYEEAVKLKAKVMHIYQLAPTGKVCGLHVPCNMRIVRSKQRYLPVLHSRKTRPST